MKTIKVCGRRDRRQADVHRISAFRSSNLNGQKNTHTNGVCFLLLVYTLDIAFLSLKTTRQASKNQIFRSQVSTKSR